MKRLQIFGIFGALIFVTGLSIYFSVSREPEYEGQTLTEWLNQSQKVYRDVSDPDHPERDPEYLKCKIAVNKMGTNAIPFLFNDLLATESKIKPEISALANRPVFSHILKRKWIGDLENIRIADRANTVQRHVQAIWGFAFLGTNAACARPRLLKLIADENRDKRFFGFCAFDCTKPPKEIFVPVATRLLKDSDDEIKNTAAQTLQNLFPEEAEKAGVYILFPELRPSLTNQTFEIP